MNPSLKFILVFIISLEISIKASLITNTIVIACALFYLIIKRIKLKTLLLVLLIPFIAAFTVFFLLRNHAIPLPELDSQKRLELLKSL